MGLIKFVMITHMKESDMIKILSPWFQKGTYQEKALK